MTNPRNLDALYELIARGWGPGWGPREIAETLAEAGVLAPSALTDEEAYSIGSGWQDGLRAADVAPDVRAQLERLARGEPQFR